MPSSLRGEPAVSQRILPPPAPRTGSRLASLHHDPEQIQDDGGRRCCSGGSVAQTDDGHLDGDFGLRSPVRAGSSLVQCGSRLAPGHVGRGPLAARPMTGSSSASTPTASPASAPVLYLRSADDGDLAATYLDAFERTWTDVTPRSRPSRPLTGRGRGRTAA
jgi:hypothetical protein